MTGNVEKCIENRFYDKNAQQMSLTIKNTLVKKEPKNKTIRTSFKCAKSLIFAMGGITFLTWHILLIQRPRFYF